MPATSVRLTDTATFPPGTVVKAYRARGGAKPFPGRLPPDRGTAPPVGAPVIAEGTMGNESVTLTGLEPSTAYMIAGQVAGEWRWQTARTEAEESAGSGISQVEADARYGLKLEVVNTSTLTSGGTYEIPDVTAATVHLLTLKASPTIKPPPPPPAGLAKAVLLYLIQDASGSRVPTFAGFRWPEGLLPTLSTNANAVDVITLVCADGVHWDGFFPGPRMT